MKKNTGNLFYFLSISGLAVLITASGFLYRSTINQSKSLSKIRNGSHICVSRVAQSFIAFSRGNFAALSLEDRFLSMTDECFDGVDSKTKLLNNSSLAILSTDMFDEYLNFKNLVRNSESKVGSVQASFNKIDKFKYSLGVKLTKSIRSLDQRKLYFRYAFLGLVLLLTLVGIAFLMTWRRLAKTIKEIEQEAVFIVDDFGNNGARIERLVERVLNFANVPILKNLYLDYNNYVTSKNHYELGTVNSPVIDNSLEDEYVMQVFQEKEVVFNVSDDEDVVDIKEDTSDENISLSEIVQKSEELNVDAAEEKSSAVVSETMSSEEDTSERFKKVVSNVTRAFLRNTPDSGLTWEFDSRYIDFSLMKHKEEFVHILHAIISRYHKGFNESEAEMHDRCINVSKEIKDGDVEISFTGKNMLFNTAELEYFNTADPSFKKMVDVNFIMLHKLVLDVKSDIEIQNNFTEDGERLGVVKIYLPLIFTNISKSIDESLAPTRKAGKSSMLSRLVKGPKKEIKKRLSKETTV